MEQIKEQIRDMIEDGCDEYEVIRFIIGQEDEKRTELHLFMESVFMEDEDIEESHDDYRVLERMWNKILFRLKRRISGCEILDWIDTKYACCVIGLHTHHELHERLANYWGKEEQAFEEEREERMYGRW